MSFGSIDGHHDRVPVFGNDAEYLDRVRDILDGLLPARLDFDRDLVAHLLRSAARCVDATGVRQRVDPGGDIHPVAIDVVALDDDVTDINANPELYPTVFGAARIRCSWTCFWTPIAQVTASTALANSTSAPSPMSLNVRPE